MRIVIRFIDSVSETSGKVICWACVALVLVLVYEVTARYVFNAPTIWAYDTSTMLGGTIAAVGWVYTHRVGGHVRIDVIYTCLSSRGKAAIDVICALLLLFPLFSAIVYASAYRMWFAWSMGEVSIESYWYPPAGPIYTVMFLGFSLFFLQAVAHFIRDLHLLIRNKPL